MLRITLSSLAVAALAFAALPAGAFTLDFVALAVGNEHAFDSEIFPNAGGSTINVTGMARDLSDGTPPYNTAPPYGYLDGLSGGKDGGFGVCPTDDCEGSPEDNISFGEVGILEFDTVVEITSISFSNGDHNDVYSGTIGIHTGATNPTTAAGFNTPINTATLVSGVLGPISLISNRFQFLAPESFGMNPCGTHTFHSALTFNTVDCETQKIYVSSITFEEFPDIPEPSSALLAGMGLLGLLAAGRRPRRA
jgi:hypothetical protein